MPRKGPATKRQLVTDPVYGSPLVTALVFGVPVTVEMPELKGFNFAGGVRVIQGVAARGDIRLVGNLKLWRRAPQTF